MNDTKKMKKQIQNQIKTKCASISIAGSARWMIPSHSHTPKPGGSTFIGAKHVLNGSNRRKSIEIAVGAIR